MPSDADACGTAASGVSTRCARSLARSTSGAESEPPGATALQGRRADTPPVRRMPRRVPRHPLQFGSRVVGSGRAGGGQPGPNDRQRLPHPNCKADAATRHRCDGCHGVSPGIPCSPGRVWWIQAGQVGVAGSQRPAAPTPPQLQGRRRDTPPVRRMPRRVPRHPLQFGPVAVFPARAGGGGWSGRVGPTAGAPSGPRTPPQLQGRRADTPPVRRMRRRVPWHPLQFGSVAGSGERHGPGPREQLRRGRRTDGRTRVNA